MVTSQKNVFNLIFRAAETIWRCNVVLSHQFLSPGHSQLIQRNLEIHNTVPVTCALQLPRPAEPITAALPKGLNYKVSHHERSSYYRDFNSATASASSRTAQQFRAGSSKENPLFIIHC